MALIGNGHGALQRDQPSVVGALVGFLPACAGVSAVAREETGKDWKVWEAWLGCPLSKHYTPCCRHTGQVTVDWIHRPQSNTVGTSKDCLLHNLQERRETQGRPSHSQMNSTEWPSHEVDYLIDIPPFKACCETNITTQEPYPPALSPTRSGNPHLVSVVRVTAAT
ncbi:uncharacterized protein ACWYII_013552 [Salvelinus alpinus]